MKIKNIGFVGFGLIGGSMGLALKKYTSHNVYAFDINENVRKYVNENNLCDGVFLPEDDFIKECDIIYIGLYPYMTVDFINENRDRFKKDAVICDLCGVKSYIIKNIDKDIRFVGAHPMAGKEVNGVENASCDQFQCASFLITEAEYTDKEAVCEIEKLAIKVGFENIVKTTPENHDEMITFTSQLPHIASVAYVLQENFKKCDGYYAGSFKDMARVAKINPYLWTELFKINKDVLCKQIDGYIDALEKIKNSVVENGGELFDILEKSRELKEWQDENYKD